MVVLPFALSFCFYMVWSFVVVALLRSWIAYICGTIYMIMVGMRALSHQGSCTHPNGCLKFLQLHFVYHALSRDLVFLLELIHKQKFGLVWEGWRDSALNLVCQKGYNGIEMNWWSPGTLRYPSWAPTQGWPCRKRSSGVGVTWGHGGYVMSSGCRTKHWWWFQHWL